MNTLLTDTVKNICAFLRPSEVKSLCCAFPECTSWDEFRTSYMKYICKKYLCNMNERKNTYNTNSNLHNKLNDKYTFDDYYTSGTLNNIYTLYLYKTESFTHSTKFPINVYTCYIGRSVCDIVKQIYILGQNIQFVRIDIGGLCVWECSYTNKNLLCIEPFPFGIPLASLQYHQVTIFIGADKVERIKTKSAVLSAHDYIRVAHTGARHFYINPGHGMAELRFLHGLGSARNAHQPYSHSVSVLWQPHINKLPYC